MWVVTGKVEGNVKDQKEPRHVGVASNCGRTGAKDHALPWVLVFC